MKLPYTTKYNGKFYHAFEEIPVAETKTEVPVTKEPELEVKVEKAEKPRKTLKK